MLEAENITVKYENRVVVDDVSFALPDGNILAILGPNGAGKSSLLRALNASLQPAFGHIRIDGYEIENLSRAEIAKRIAVVAQENETRFPVTALEFVLAGRFASGRVFGWDADADLGFARQALKECDLAGFESRLMNNLSGGERQRVVLARSLATGAKILLLDEPTANLDLAHQASTFRLVREKCSAKQHCAVVITHDLNLAARFADQIIALKNGKVLAAGSPENALTKERMRELFNVEVLIDKHPGGGMRFTTMY